MIGMKSAVRVNWFLGADIVPFFEWLASLFAFPLDILH